VLPTSLSGALARALCAVRSESGWRDGWVAERPFSQDWAPCPGSRSGWWGHTCPQCVGGLLPGSPGRFRLVYLNSYVNNPQAVMNNEGGFLRWVMCGR